MGKVTTVAITLVVERPNGDSGGGRVSHLDTLKTAKWGEDGNPSMEEQFLYVF